MTTLDAGLIRAVSVRDHFSAALDAAARNQDVRLKDVTAVYVVNLLTEFCATSALSAVSDAERHIKPLALIYGEALDAPTVEQRRRTLQHLGDLALFISGIFSDSLGRKSVDVDYYIGMGEAAYGYVHDSLRQGPRSAIPGELFAELGRKFSALVDLLSEISEMSGLRSNSGMLRTYELWQKTGSARALRQLRRAGIVPFPGAGAAAH